MSTPSNMPKPGRSPSPAKPAAPVIPYRSPEQSEAAKLAELERRIQRLDEVAPVAPKVRPKPIMDTAQALILGFAWGMGFWIAGLTLVIFLIFLLRQFGWIRY